jgi:hypothetical protein
VQDDPATHFAWAKPGHFCYRIRPAQPISPEHQENFCLNGKYPTCVVYPASWKGALPAGVRDDGYSERSRRTVGIKSPDTSAAKTSGEADKGASQFGADLALLRDQADFIEDDIPAPVPWWKKRWGMVLLAVLLILPVVILSVWAIVNNSRAQEETLNIPPASVSTGAEPSETVDAALIVVLPNSPTPEPATPTLAAPALSPTNIPTATSTLNPTQIPASPTPIIGLASNPAATNPTPLIPDTTATPNPFTCEEKGAYTYEVDAGPLLTPEAGTDFRTGDIPPTVSSAWQIRNTSSCTWNNILMLSVASNRLLLPFLRVDGALIFPQADEQNITIEPGEIVEVGLGFPLYMARGIKSEWALVINGFRLVEQPRLQLDITNWIIGMEPKATQSIPDTSSSSRDDDEPPPPPSVRP